MTRRPLPGALVALVASVGPGCARTSEPAPRDTSTAPHAAAAELTPRDDTALNRDTTPGGSRLSDAVVRQPLTGSVARDLAERFIRAARGEPEHGLKVGPALLLEVDGKRSRHTSAASLDGALGLDRAVLASLELDPRSVFSEDTPDGAAVHAEVLWAEAGRFERARLVLGVTQGDLDYAIVSAVLQDTANSADSSK